MFGKNRDQKRAQRVRRILGAAAEYLSACCIVDEDERQRRVDDVLTRVDGMEVMDGVVEVARRALVALAAERQVTVEELVQSLISTDVADPDPAHGPGVTGTGQL